MKKLQLSYAEIELLLFILKNFKTDTPHLRSMTNSVYNLQLKLITMIAQMEYEKRD